jgi:hypothetical protein
MNIDETFAPKLTIAASPEHGLTVAHLRWTKNRTFAMRIDAVGPRVTAELRIRAAATMLALAEDGSEHPEWLPQIFVDHGVDLYVELAEGSDVYKGVM